jgi:DNA-binding transcriptional LysR family regulator
LSREVSALVRRGEAALGLRYFPDPDPGLVSLPLYREALVIVCAPGHRLARARRPTARMLDGQPWVAFPARPGGGGDGYAQMLTERLAALGLSVGELIPIDSLTAQKRLVEAGFGLGLMPESSVQEELRLGTLRALRLSAMRLGVPVVLMHRRRAFLSGAARAVIALLRDGHADGPTRRGAARAPGRLRPVPPPRPPS